MQNGTVSGADVVGKDVVFFPKDAARARKRSIRIANKLRHQMLCSLNRQLFLIKRDKFIYRLRFLWAMRFTVFSFFRFELPLLFLGFIIRVTAKSGNDTVLGHSETPSVNSEETPNV